MGYCTLTLLHGRGSVSELWHGTVDGTTWPPVHHQHPQWWGTGPVHLGCEPRSKEASVGVEGCGTGTLENRKKSSSHCNVSLHFQWASYQICKIAGCACAGNAGNVSPRRRIQRKLLVSDPGMHHGTCVTHVPWCMSVSLTHGGGENVPGIPGACASAILRIWQEAH